jgi:cysteine desulfurase
VGDVTYPAVYLDAASAEPLHPAAREVLQAAVARGYADPRRLHGPGRDARLLLDNAREVVASVLGVRRDEVMFTTSGSAAVHGGLLGLLPPGGAPVVATAVEHQSVPDAARWSGVALRAVEVDRHGRVDADAVVATARAAGAGLVAGQQANHEVGTVQPVDAVAERLGDLPLVVDAGASMGRLPLPAGWSAVAGSARKWGGPGGVGVLLVRRSARWRHPFPAADPTERTDHGFTDVAGALAAAAALQAVVAERAEVGARQRELIDVVRAGVARLPEVDLVGDPVDRLPHLVTFSCLYVDGEALLAGLDRRGFAVSSGSSCTSSTLEPSHVLVAMGALTSGSVRVSLHRDTTAAEVDEFLAVLPAVVAEVRAELGADGL